VGWIAQSVKRLATAWTVLGSNSAESQAFCTRPDWHRDPPSLL